MQGSQTRACEWEGKEPLTGAGPGLPGSVGMVRQEWGGGGGGGGQGAKDIPMYIYIGGGAVQELPTGRQ